MRKKAGIYTRKGDGGQTSLSDGQKAPKDDPRICALGTVDELNSWLGLLCSYCQWSADVQFYQSIQSDMFVIGAIIGKTQDMVIDQDRISYIEEMIDNVSSGLVPLRNFILPGGNVEAAWLHYARSVCRRAEREIVRVPGIEQNVLVYMNRLSDLFFVKARQHNDLGKSDILWNKECPLKGS